MLSSTAIQPEHPPVIRRFLPEDADTDFIGVEGVFKIAHLHAILERISELLAVILLDESGLNEVLPSNGIP